VSVLGLGNGVMSINAGVAHSCAVTSGGGAKCWGANFHGYLGDNSTTDRHAPVDVSGLTSGVAEISTGLAHTCALTTAGGVKCWGFNGQGQLGDNTRDQHQVPVDVVGLVLLCH
jgi:alpha-tubulin suppressor-like RCC1 family protein